MMWSGRVQTNCFDGLFGRLLAHSRWWYFSGNRDIEIDLNEERKNKNRSKESKKTTKEYVQSNGCEMTNLRMIINNTLHWYINTHVIQITSMHILLVLLLLLLLILFVPVKYCVDYAQCFDIKKAHLYKKLCIIFGFLHFFLNLQFKFGRSKYLDIFFKNLFLLLFLGRSFKKSWHISPWTKKL